MVNVWGALLLGSAAYAAYLFKTAPDENDVSLADATSKEMELAAKAVELRKTGIHAQQPLHDLHFRLVYPGQINDNVIPVTSGDPYLDAAALEIARERYHLEMLEKPINSTPFYIPAASDRKPIIVTTLTGAKDAGIPEDYVFQTSTGLRKKRGGTHQKY